MGHIVARPTWHLTMKDANTYFNKNMVPGMCSEIVPAHRYRGNFIASIPAIELEYHHFVPDIERPVPLSDDEDLSAEI